MKRILLTIQFLGTNYSGWQVQPGLNTIQGEIERAINETTGEKIKVHSCGRTDAGVHALGLTAHFDTDTRINPENIYKALNTRLPSDIRVLSSREVDEHFHARYDVKEKTYEYNFYISGQPLPYYSITEACVQSPFDYERAKSNISAFLGTHDFVGFASSRTEVASTVRTITKITLSRHAGEHYTLSVTGNGFLYNMVRIIAGTIIEIGQGKIDPAELPQIIESKDRKRAGDTAAANGLVLKSVKYS